MVMNESQNPGHGATALKELPFYLVTSVFDDKQVSVKQLTNGHYTEFAQQTGTHN